VCGDAFTLGDLSGAIGTDYLMLMDVAPPARVRAWRDRCFAIPEVAGSDRGRLNPTNPACRGR
jgi:glutathione S-transferase